MCLGNPSILQSNDPKYDKNYEYDEDSDYESHKSAFLSRRLLAKMNLYSPYPECYRTVTLK